jgi:transposase InsO family protein
VENLRYLKRRLQQMGSADDVRQAVLAAVDIKQYGNQNAAKLTDWHRHLTLHYMSHGKNHVVREVYELVAYASALNNQREPSFEAIKALCEKPEFRQLAAPGRLGLKRHRNEHQAYGLRKGPLYPGDLWESDGTRMSFKYLGTDRKGKPAVKFLDWLPVMDGYSYAIIGFAVGEAEGSHLARQAIRLAAKITGYLPFEILTDNGSAFKAGETKQLMERLTQVVARQYPERFAGGESIHRNAEPYNARDKRIERVFQTMQNYVGRLYANYAGEGILSTRDNARPSPEYQAAAEHHLPNRDQVMLQIAEAVEFYNRYEVPQRNGSREASPWQRLTSLKPEWNTPLSPIQQVMLFADRTQVTVRNGLLRLKVMGADYEYRLYRTEHLTAYEGRRVQVYYDPADMSTVEVYEIDPKQPNETGAAIDQLRQAGTFHMARANQTSDDITEMSKVKAHRRRVEREQQDMRENLRARATDVAPVSEAEALSLVDVRKAALNDAESSLLVRLFTDHHGLSLASHNKYRHDVPHDPEPEPVAVAVVKPQRQKPVRSFHDAGFDGARRRTPKPMND